MGSWAGGRWSVVEVGTGSVVTQPVMSSETDLQLAGYLLTNSDGCFAGTKMNEGLECG